MFPFQHIKRENFVTEMQNLNLTAHLVNYNPSSFMLSNGNQDIGNFLLDPSTFSNLLCDTEVKLESDILKPQATSSSIRGCNTSLKCRSCEFSCASISELKSHIEVHVNSGPCGYFAVNQSLFDKQKQSHSKVKKIQYKCDICDYSASDTFRIKRHLNSHKTVRDHKCDVCESTFKDKSTLRSHQKIHTDAKPYKCTYCDYASVRSTSLRLHVRTHTGEKPYECAYCGHCSAYQRHFKLHMMRVHFKVKPFKCDLCDYNTTESFQLKKHTMRIHQTEVAVSVGLGEKEFQCSLCSFVTARSSSLNRHMKIHTGDKPFVCMDCGHATAYKNHLALHRMRAHLGLKPHRCTLCSYSASASNQLKRHMLTHMKNRPKQEDIVTYDQNVGMFAFIGAKNDDKSITTPA